MLPPSNCPLCAGNQTHFYHEDNVRTYWQCQCCDLVFVTPSDLPPRAREKQEYDLHQNNAEDEGYIRFLSKVATPLTPLISQTTTGLDFGCGPSPVLAGLLGKHGAYMEVYDPFYFPNEQVLTGQYDIITCTEAIEHFHTPSVELTTLVSLLSTSGTLAIMTKRVIDQQRFTHWHYKNDITHVSFFSLKTFEWIADKYQLALTVISDDVVFLKKLDTSVA